MRLLVLFFVRRRGRGSAVPPPQAPSYAWPHSSGPATQHAPVGGSSSALLRHSGVSHLRDDLNRHRRALERRKMDEPMHHVCSWREERGGRGWSCSSCITGPGCSKHELFAWHERLRSRHCVADSCGGPDNGSAWRRHLKWLANVRLDCSRLVGAVRHDDRDGDGLANAKHRRRDGGAYFPIPAWGCRLSMTGDQHEGYCRTEAHRAAPRVYEVIYHTLLASILRCHNECQGR